MQFSVEIDDRVWEGWARKNKVLVEFAAQDAEPGQSAPASALEVLLATALSTNFMKLSGRLSPDESSSALMLATGLVHVRGGDQAGGKPNSQVDTGTS